MARSIYQGSAAAVCQARELSARRRARGLEKKATGSFLLPFCSLRYPLLSLSLSLFLPVRVLALDPSSSFTSIYLSFFSASLSSSSFVSSSCSLLRCFWVIFHRCSGRQKRRDAAEAALPRIRTRRRARARETAYGGGGCTDTRDLVDVQCTRLSDVSS